MLRKCRRGSSLQCGGVGPPARLVELGRDVVVEAMEGSVDVGCAFQQFGLGDTALTQGVFHLPGHLASLLAHMANGTMLLPTARFRTSRALVRLIGLEGGSCGIEYLAGSVDSCGDVTDRCCGLTADLPGVAVLGEQQVNAFPRRRCVWAGDVGVGEGARGDEDAPGTRSRGHAVPIRQN